MSYSGIHIHVLPAFLEAAVVPEKAEELAETINQLSDIENLEKTTSAWQDFLASIPEKGIQLGVRVLVAAFFLFVGSRLIRLVIRLLVKSLDRVSVDRGVITFLSSLTRVLLYFLLIMLVASSFGVDAASIIALLGSAGIAAGLALQGSLSNMAGGVILLIVKPFVVGDYIREDAHGNEGFVTDIRIFHTYLRTIDNKIVMIPNGTLCNTSLVNYTRSEKRQLDYAVGISYESDLLQAKEILLEIVRAEEGVFSDPEPVVFVKELGESAIVLGARAWIANARFIPANWHINETVKLEFDRKGISIPYNQLDVHMKQA